jgi:hypothetical protein
VLSYVWKFDNSKLKTRNSKPIMREGTQILGRANRFKSEQTEDTCRIGQVASKFLNEQVSPRQSVYGAVIEVWNQILPAELAKHCRIEDISAGQLTIAVDSPSYRFELNLCSAELLRELQKRCHGCRLKKIKFTTN